MAEENKLDKEKKLAEPFEKLSHLPTKPEEITQADKEASKKLFEQIIESVKNGHSVTIAEYNALSRMHKVYEFNAILQSFEAEQQKAIAQELKNAGSRKDILRTKALHSFTQNITTTSVKDLKQELKSRISTLNDSLELLEGEFKPEQVQQLKDFLEKYRTNPALQNKDGSLKINVDKLFMDVIEPQRGKSTATPAFTTLYNQVAPQPEPLADPETTNALGNSLNAVRSAVEAANAQTNEGAETPTDPVIEPETNENAEEAPVVEPETPTDPVIEPETNENADDPIVINPEPIIISNDSPTLTDDEINAYIDELKKSDKETLYLDSISPKISEEAILAAMALNGEDQIWGANDENGNFIPYSVELNATKDRAIALSNPDDMLVAYDYFQHKYNQKDRDQKIADLEEVIKNNLRKYTATDITPENAFALLTLAEKIQKNEYTYYKVYPYITEQIALSQQAYDEEHFGKPLAGETKEQQAEHLNENYTKGLEALVALDAEKTLALLNDYTFTDDNGKPLEDKNRSWLNPKRLWHGNDKGNELSDTKDSIIETARLMVAQDLAKEGLPLDLKDVGGPSTEEQLLGMLEEKIDLIMAPSVEPDVMNALNEYIKKENPNIIEEQLNGPRIATLYLMQKNNTVVINDVADVKTRQDMGLPLEGEIDEKLLKEYTKKLKANTELVKKNVSYSKSNVGARLGSTMVAGPETFKTRITQKFQNTPFYKTVHGKWNTVDKKLENRFGKPYINGKKVAKYVAKIAPGLAKSTAQFAVAGLIPGGVPALIAYNTYKQFKQLPKQLKNEKSTAQKSAMIAGIALTSALSAVTAATGTAGLLSSVGIDFSNPALMESVANFGTHFGVGARVGISAIGASLPNAVNRITSAYKATKLKKQIAKETNPDRLKELNEQQKKLQTATKNNRNEWYKKAIAVGVGLLVAQGVSAASSVTATDNSTEVSETPSETTQPEGKTQPHAIPADTLATEKPDTLATEKTDTLATEKTDTLATEKTETVAPEKAETVATEKEAETLSIQEQNLAAANEAGSGHIGKSDMESMQKDLNGHYGERMNYSAEEKVALMKSLAEGYGTNSYEAMHAAMAEPRILAAQMGITADVEASAQAAGIDTSTQYSKAVLNHLATHPELADNEGFKSYVSEHFDEQDRFHSSNYTVHTATHAPAAAAHAPAAHAPAAAEPTAPAPAENTQSTGFKLERVARIPTEQTQTEVRDAQVTQVAHTATTHTAPVHTSPTSGLIYDPLLSEGLNHAKWQGAYLDPNHMINGKPAVVYLPADPVHGTPKIDNMDDAMKMHEYAGGDTLGIYRSRTGVDLNNPENNSYYGYGYGGRVLYNPTGCIGHTTVSTGEVSFGKILAQEAAARVTDIALRQGEHALHHVIENALGKGRN